MAKTYFNPAEYYRGYHAFPYVGMGESGGKTLGGNPFPFVPKDKKLWDAMQPNKERLATGMIPESAIKLIANYIVSSVNLGNLLQGMFGGLGTATTKNQITGIFYTMCLYEYHIEANLPGLKKFWPLEWNWNIEDTKQDARRTYDIMYKVLETKTHKEQMRWANNSMTGFFTDFNWDTSNQPWWILSKFGRVHGWDEYEQWMFWYRLLVNFLHASMQAMKQVGLPPEEAFSSLRHTGMTQQQSTDFNRWIVNISAKDWVKMGYGELFSPQDMIDIEDVNEEFEAKKVQQWKEYTAKQAALNKKIESLEVWERRLKGMATPFEMIKKALGGFWTALEFIGKVPAWVWLGVLGGGVAWYSYPTVIKPLLEKRKG